MFILTAISYLGFGVMFYLAACILGEIGKGILKFASRRFLTREIKKSIESQNDEIQKILSE